MKPLFVKESRLGLRIVLTLLVVAGLIVADLRFNSLDRTRALLDTLVTPVYWVADIPSRLSEWQQTHLVSRSVLQEESERLRRENLILEGRTQQMASLQAENIRLRGLLNSAALLRDDVVVAELIGVSPDPVRQQVVINKGARDGVYLGQALIDADGLMGQVVEVAEFTSRVLLITDLTHSVPVQINRNGVRAIAEGNGTLSALEIHHVAATTDIREGDLLVTSGLGGRFPVGYPVAVVSAVERDPGQTFARILAQPTAALDRSRHVLLVFTVASTADEAQ
ncbi:rod shape-determining protein MreC [Parahaliea mediterranea]|uniref:rod shape-determining protein MreC n=1 Tax=Parahaliea mediterranea TaxID=651086 RepID=UPI000E2EF105|nr:rod shape-determining protein MreC [Parahaliea mediterranea]